MLFTCFNIVLCCFILSLFVVLEKSFEESEIPVLEHHTFAVKRPAAALKRSAATLEAGSDDQTSDGTEQPQQQKKVNKKPSVTNKVMKKPVRQDADVQVPENRFELRPTGCSKCRGMAGCTRSCWKYRGY